MKKNLGTHLLIDAWGCPRDLLDNPELISDVIDRAITAGDVTKINMTVHQFSPHGVTATATLAESHIALHTWPEHGYFAADIFFCGNKDPYRSIEPLLVGLCAARHKVRRTVRGFDLSRTTSVDRTQTAECDHNEEAVSLDTA